MTTVSGIVRDTEQNAIAGASVSVVYRKPLVGFNGGAAVQNVRQFTTAGDGTLTMADLVPGHYDITIAIVANDNTTETVLRRGTMTVLDQETQTLQNALDASFEPITPSDVQRAEAAAAAAEASETSAAASSAAAGAASGRLVVRTFAELATVPVYADPGAGQQITAAGDYWHVLEIDAFCLVLASGASGADLDYTGSGGVKFEVLSAAALAFGAVGDGVTNDSAVFKKIEASDLGPTIDLGGKSYALTSFWADATNGTRLTKDYRNGTLIVDGRELVIDSEFGRSASAAARARLPKTTSRKSLGLLKRSDNEYEVWTHKTGPVWTQQKLQRASAGVPFNLNEGWFKQVLAYKAAAEEGCVYNGDWAALDSGTYNLTSGGTAYIGGRAKQAIKAGEYVDVTFTGGGDLYVVFTGRASGSYVNVLLDGAQNYLTLPDDGSGNRFFDSYTAVDLSGQQIVQVASGVPEGENTLRLTVSSTKNASSTGNRFVFEAASWSGVETGPWTPEADAPLWASGEVVQFRQERKSGNNYYFADGLESEFTASISGTTMTVTAVAADEVRIGATLYGANVTDGTVIVSQTTGTAGGAGDYEVDTSQTAASGTVSGYGGETGSTAPTHTSGAASDGKVTWVYKATSSYDALTDHRFQAPGSQLEYAYQIEPTGATSFEDVGGAMHGNETQTSFQWYLSGAKVTPPTLSWLIGENIEVRENFDVTHSEIGGGSTVVGDAVLRRRFVPEGFEISHERDQQTAGEFGYDYPHMWPLLHYSSIGQKYGITEIWSPSDGERICANWYGENNPFVARTKDTLQVATGGCLQPDGSGGTPTNVAAPYRFTAWLDVDPESVDFYRTASSVFASKAMNTSGADVSSGGFSSMTSKLYFERNATLNPTPYAPGEKIACSAFYGITVEGA